MSAPSSAELFALILNGKLAEADERAQPWANEDAAVATEYGVGAAVKALITEAPEDCAEAMARLSAAETLLTPQKKSFFSSAEPAPLHHAVRIGEIYLFYAFISFRTGNLLKGGYYFRRSWKEYERLLKSGEAPHNNTDTRSALSFGVGWFYFFVSLVPKSFLWIVEMLGFRANRQRGLELLRDCYSSGGYMAPGALVMLIWIHIFFLQEIDTASTLYEDAMKKFPTGPAFLFLGGYLKRKQGKIQEAMENFSAAYEHGREMRAFQLSALYEKGWCHLMLREWEEAAAAFEAFLAEFKAPSIVAYCGYQLGVCYQMMGKIEQSVAAFEAVAPKVRKHYTFDQFAGRKSREYAALRVLPEKERLLIRASLEIQAREYQGALNTLEEAQVEQDVAEEDVEGHSYLTDYWFLRGRALRRLGRVDEARRAFEAVRALENTVTAEVYRIPHAMVELAELEFGEENFAEAEALLKEAKAVPYSYDFDKPLSRRIGGVLDKLKNPEKRAKHLLKLKENVADAQAQLNAGAEDEENDEGAELFELDPDLGLNLDLEADYYELLNQMKENDAENRYIITDVEEEEQQRDKQQRQMQKQARKEEAAAAAAATAAPTQTTTEDNSNMSSDALPASTSSYLSASEEDDIGSLLMTGSDVSATATPSISLKKLEEKRDALRAGVSVKNRWWRLKQYPDCFVGAAAVDWMVKNLPDDCPSREAAVRLGQQLLSAHFIHHVAYDQPFRDGKFFYRFQENAQTSTLNESATIWKVAARPAPQVMASLLEQANRLLERFSTAAKGTVQLERLIQSSEFVAFTTATGELQAVDLTHLLEPERRLFFINAYNLLSMHAVFSRGVPEKSSFFSSYKYNISGHKCSLDDIEHGILRCNARPPSSVFRSFSAGDARLQWTLSRLDPRIHFAINCATRSSPKWRFFPMTEEAGEWALSEASSAFLQHWVRVGKGKDNNFDNDGAYVPLWLPRLFKWYGGDFGGSQQLLDLVEHYAFPPSQRKLLRKFVALRKLKREPFKIMYHDYDWSLQVTPAEKRVETAEAITANSGTEM